VDPFAVAIAALLVGLILPERTLEDVSREFGHRAGSGPHEGS
jgi:hypothetical protein